jgi:excisionase family DNA binding protein
VNTKQAPRPAPAPELHHSALSDLPSRIAAHPGALRAADLVTLLGMSRSKVYEWVQSGRIPYFRIGDAIRFDPLRVAEWLRASEVRAAA